jgi:SMODS and SLOG-associating 2TM effector domain 1
VSAAGDWQAQYVAAYRRYRLDDQRAYYGARSRSYERARRMVITMSAVLMVFAACFGALGAADADRRALWAFLAAGVAALGTAFTSFEAAFALERSARLYDQAERGLALVAAETPPAAALADDGAEALIDVYTTRVERIIDDESDTWSHYTRATDSAGGEEEPAPAPGD